MKVEASAEVALRASRPSLRERRLPQLLGAYLAGAWTGFQFVQWLTDRFVLSPYVEDAFLLTLLCVTPSVVLLAYRHGARGRQALALPEKIGVPCNLLGAALLLFALFGDKDLGSAREVVAVVDEDGTRIERTIPKSDFRTRLAVFAFDNDTGDPGLDWLAYGLTELVQVDLGQEPFVAVATGRSFATRIEEHGFDGPEQLPLALQRTLARDWTYGYVLGGRFTRSAAGDTLTLHARLLNTDTGREVGLGAIAAASPWGLADALTERLKRALELPRQHVAETPDLPVAELTTASLPALRAYADGRRRRAFTHAQEGLDEPARRALDHDPTFALAHLELFGVLRDAGRREQAMGALRAAKQHSYRLTEPMRYNIQAWLFFFEHEPEAALRTARQWAAFFPEDADAYGLLTQLHTVRGETAEAIAAMRRVEALDPARSYAIQIGDLLREAGRVRDAIDEYERYVSRFPQRRHGYERLGLAHRSLGHLDAEAEAYARALVADPDAPDVRLRLGDVAMRRGQFDDARRHYEQALLRARRPAEHFFALRRQADFAWLRGDYPAYLELADSAWSTYASYANARSLATNRTLGAWREARAGAEDRARATVAAARAHPGYGTDDILTLNVDLGAALLADELGETVAYDALLARADALFAAYGVRQAGLFHYQGVLLQRAGRLERADAAFREQLALSAAGDMAERGRLRRAEVLAVLGREDEAATLWEYVLTSFPSHPEAHLGLARLRADDAPAEARRHARRALETWADADPRHAGAAAAHTLLRQLR